MRSEREPEIQGLGPAAVMIIVLLTVALSALIWFTMKRQVEAEMERRAASTASGLREAIESEVDGVYDALRARAGFLRSLAELPDLWLKAVDLFLHENPSILAIMPSDPNRPVVGSEEGRKVLNELLPLVRQRAASANGEFLMGPVKLADGRPIFGIQVRSAEPSGRSKIFAVFDPQRVLSAILDRRGHGYGVAVSVEGEEIYRREPAGATPLAGITETDTVSPGAGKPWSVVVWPTSQTSEVSYDLAPLVALAAGLLLSILITASVHFGTLSWRRAEALNLANAELGRLNDELRRAEGEVRQLSDDLEARVSDRTADLNDTIVELETFNYSVSHDLRAPLGAVINFAAILAEDCRDRLDASGREHLDRIVRSASAAVSMMDALLAYSRSGRTELRRVPLHVRRLVQEVYDELVAASPHLSDAVKIGDLPDAYADENMMRFIFANLISNACKFVRPGEMPRVEIGGSATPTEVTFFVRDEGIGFDMRYEEKLFRVFERLHTSDQYEGHGVGLAIVGRMVRRHGGRVWAQGAIDKGATFYFAMSASEIGRA